jgi:uncharacterized protein (TIGR02284 family)
MGTAARIEKYDSRHLGAARTALSEVIAVCREGTLGYSEAAKDVDHPVLKELFNAFADQRRIFADTLERHAIWLGGTPDGMPRNIAWIHRKWLDIRSTIDLRSAVNLLAECERGEHAALAKYERALSIPMPQGLRTILLDQMMEIREVHDQLDRMRRR